MNSELEGSCSFQVGTARLGVIVSSNTMCAVVNLYSHFLHSFPGLGSLDKSVQDCFFPTTSIVVITFTL